MSNYTPDLPIYLDRVVVGTGFEPVWQGWKPCILTPRWTDHLIIVDTVGIEPIRSDCKSVDLPSASGPFERETRFELATYSLEGYSSTNWATPAVKRAGNQVRTGDPDLGKVMLYQLSYSRFCVPSRIRTLDLLVNSQLLYRWAKKT